MKQKRKGAEIRNPQDVFFSSFFPRTFSIFPPLPGTDKNTFVDAFLLTCTYLHTHFQKLPKGKRDLSPVAGRIKGRQNENILLQTATVALKPKTHEGLEVFLPYAIRAPSQQCHPSSGGKSFV